MFKEKNIHSQMSYSNPYAGLTPQKREKLQQSWAGIFYKEVYCQIDESIFEVLYSTKGSRPNIPVRTLVSALCLKEAFHLNDSQLIEQIEWNRQYQVALGLDSDQVPFTERSLTRFRRRLFDYECQSGIDLVHEAIKDLLDHFSQEMKTDRNIRRMDSFQIESNIRVLSRLELVYETNRVCIRALKKRNVGLPEALFHYLGSEDHNNFFYHDRNLDYDQKSRLLIHETEEILSILKASKTCPQELSLLERLISDHMVEDEGKLRLKKNKSEGLNSQVIQSPHDPDATYRDKKGPHRGYVGNIQESACEDGSMIEDYQYEKNTHSDSEFMQEFIQDQEYHPLENPLMIITDGAYGSEENHRKAQDKGIRHIPTELSGRKTEDICADFEFNKEGTEVITCPNGIKPIKCSFYPETGQCRAVFELECCQNCPLFDKCHPTIQKKTAVKIISSKSVFRAQTRRDQSGEDFNQFRKFRNGAEAVPAILRQKYNIDRMPVRGLIRTRHFFGFKIGGLAFNKYLRFLDRQNKRLKRCA